MNEPIVSSLVIYLIDISPAIRGFFILMSALSLVVVAIYIFACTERGEEIKVKYIVRFLSLTILLFLLACLIPTKDLLTSMFIAN